MSGSKISTTEIPISLRFKISKEDLISESQDEEWGIQSEKLYVQEVPGVSYYVGIASIEKHEINSENGKYSNLLELYWNYIGKTDELFDATKNFIVNDNLVVSMEAILSVQKEESEGTGSVTKLSKCCKLGLELWESDEKDFDIIADDKNIKVHKLIVGTKSPVFDRMIKSGLKESNENKVLITDFDFDIVVSGIKFCYGIKEKHLWNVEKSVELMRFADKYDINDLKTSTETFLSSKISLMNVCKIANASILGNSIKLRQKCFEYLFECNQKKIFVRDLKLLDKDFAVELLEASFSRIVSAVE